MLSKWMMWSLLPAAAAMMAGCNSSGERSRDEGADAEERGLRPGEYETRMSLRDLKSDSLTPDQITQLRSGFEQQFESQRETECLSEAEARNPLNQVFSRRDRSGEDQECEVRDPEWRDGRITGEMVCRGGEGFSLTADLRGDYERDGYEIEADGEMEIEGLSDPIQVRLQVTGERVGECGGDRGRDRDRDRE